MEKLNFKQNTNAFKKFLDLSSKFEYYNANEFYITPGQCDGVDYMVLTIDDLKTIVYVPLNDNSIDILEGDEISYHSWDDISLEKAQAHLEELLNRTHLFAK